MMSFRRSASNTVVASDSDPSDARAQMLSPNAALVAPEFLGPLARVPVDPAIQIVSETPGDHGDLHECNHSKAFLRQV